jgi:hypothetical protein
MRLPLASTTKRPASIRTLPPPGTTKLAVTPEADANVRWARPSLDAGEPASVAQPTGLLGATLRGSPYSAHPDDQLSYDW